MKMDVDMRSPSFRNARTAKTKRPRSPPSPSPYERPSKRLSMGGAPTHPFPQPVTAPPAMRERQVSEDWVTRTRSLSIDGIADQPMNLAPVVEMVLGGQNDNMNMDQDEPMSMPQPRDSPMSPPIPAQDPLPSFPMSFSNSNSLSSAFPPSSSTLSTTTSSTLLSQPAVSSSPFPSPVASSDTPSFSHIAQASPDFSAQEQVQTHHQPQNTSQMPAPTLAAMVSARKQRFTMGPRADCEKCRLGVPGHWMHFD